MNTEEHPDSEEWRYQQDSVLFRRGLNSAISNENFTDVINGLQEACKNKEHIDLLVVGVAEGQEPISLLAVLDSIAKSRRKTLGEFADLHLVDVRDQLDTSHLEYRAYKHVIETMFPGNSIIKDALEPDEDYMQYRIKQPLVEYFKVKIKDPSRSHWNTTIQRYLIEEDRKTYDCISYNNIDGHILSSEDRNFVIQGLLSRLRKGGVLITDAEYCGSKTLKALPNYEELKATYDLTEIHPGVFQRRA